jgi:hypothetical protein
VAVHAAVVRVPSEQGTKTRHRLRGGAQAGAGPAKGRRPGIGLEAVPRRTAQTLATLQVGEHALA